MKLKSFSARGLSIARSASERRHVQRAEIAAEGPSQAVLQVVPLHRGQEADGPVVDAEDRYVGSRETAQRIEDAAVSAQDDADIGPLAVLHRLDPCGRIPVLAELVGVEISRTDAALAAFAAAATAAEVASAGASGGCE